MTVTRKTFLYTILSAFFAFGIAIDWLVWGGLPPHWTWNDITQMLGVIILCLMWQSADAQARAVPHRKSARIITILLPPLGMLIYFFQSRLWPLAILGAVLFWAGPILAAFITDEVCYRLLT